VQEKFTAHNNSVVYSTEVARCLTHRSHTLSEYKQEQIQA